MTQEEKSLLLKDLCGRLSYGVIVTDNRHGNSFITEIDTISNTAYCSDFDEYISIEKCSPYLRPMSSMTEEEEDLLSEFNCYYINGELFFSCGHSQEDIYNAIDWLNTHHFDYRGLIDKGLALEAPEGMYNIKKK